MTFCLTWMVFSQSLQSWDPQRLVQMVQNIGPVQVDENTERLVQV